MTAVTTSQPSRPSTSVLRGVIVGGSLAYVLLVAVVMSQATAPLDATVRTDVLRLSTPVLHAAFSGVSWAGSIVVLGPLACLVAFGLWRRRPHGDGARAVLLSLSSVLVTWVLKEASHRTRPPGASAFPWLGYSFPSGHSLETMAIGVTVSYVSIREGWAPRWSLTAAILFSLLVGLSRVYLDVHWITDVLAGWAGGVVVAGGCAVSYETSRRDRDVSRVLAP